MRILVLEPYYGGSHRIFLEQLAAEIPWQWDILSLPARGWKWRMRLSAPWFASLLAAADVKRPDRVLCSTFVDVAALRALGPSWLREVPVCTYFHENQFVYPVRKEDARDVHFAFTNYTTALASDRLAFNSRYNLTTFLLGVEELLKKAPDMGDGPWKAFAQTIAEKSRIIPPGIDTSALDAIEKEGAERGKVIVWNHRWEHDKNPELFFETLFSLDQKGIDFSLIVVGQSFAASPEIFERARKRLGHRIVHFGHVESRAAYLRLLRQGDIVVSTANHEFYGIAVLEAVRAGCRPYLPNRLSYPELFAEKYLYPDDAAFAPGLEALLRRDMDFSENDGLLLTEPFSWSSLGPRFQEWLE